MRLPREGVEGEEGFQLNAEAPPVLSGEGSNWRRWDGVLGKRSPEGARPGESSHQVYQNRF